MPIDFVGAHYAAGDVAAVDMTGPMTCHAWVKPDSLSAGSPISKFTSGGSGGQYLLRMGGTVGFFMLDSGASGHEGFALASCVKVGVWQTVAGRYNGPIGAGALWAFHNGIPGTPDSMPSNNPNSSVGMFIGIRGDGGEQFDGKIAHASIWDVNLTNEELRWLARGASPLLIRPGNLRGYWPLEGHNTGLATRDRSRYQTTLTPAGAGTLVPVPDADLRLAMQELPLLMVFGAEVEPQFAMQPTMIGPTTELYTPYFVPGAPAFAPFISSTTALYTPAISRHLTGVPFIDEASVVHVPTMRRSSMTLQERIEGGTQLFVHRLARPLANVTPPVVSGTAMEGQQLEASPGTWSGDPPITYTYQWRRCNAVGGACVDVAGETAFTYIVQSADVGGTLRIRVIATQT